ncbi:MAG: hypothetical protein IBX45_12580 [Campylobacterales bacterium]|nr:hypothetical protein [Campylobacterales bacterium]
MSFKKWIGTLCILASALIITIVLVNISVDPYGRRQILCENHFKPIAQERSFKYHDIFRNKNYAHYDSLILGSSRVMQLLPVHFLSSSPYNFGVHVANNAEKLFIFQEWLKNAPLKILFLGIDFHNFHPEDNIGKVNKEKFLKQENYGLLSFDVFQMSLKSLANQYNNNPQTYFNTDGSLVYHAYDEQIANNLYDFSDQKMQQLAKEAYGKWSNMELTLPANAFDDLLQIQKLAKEHDVTVIAFITPMHQTGYDTFYSDSKLMDFSKEIKRGLAASLDTVYDFDIAHPYHQVNENFYDLVHYRPQLGDTIIQTLEGNITTYGIKLQREAH